MSKAAETITIRNDGQGIARQSGTDEHGNAWIEFEVDYMAEQETGTCSICDAELESGWLCLDGGEEVCDDHVVLLPWKSMPPKPKVESDRDYNIRIEQGRIEQRDRIRRGEQ